MVREILLLGNPKLYQKSERAEKNEASNMACVVDDLHDTLMDYRKKHGAGRAIAAPQIGVFKRLIYMHIDKPVVFLNPKLYFEDDECMDVLDDCMCFPELLVKLRRHKRCVIVYQDLSFNNHIARFEGDLSELLQHEYDHLDGILATMRAIDNKAFCLANQKEYLKPPQ